MKHELWSILLWKHDNTLQLKKWCTNSHDLSQVLYYALLGIVRHVKKWSARVFYISNYIRLLRSARRYRGFPPFRICFRFPPRKIPNKHNAIRKIEFSAKRIRLFGRKTDFYGLLSRPERVSMHYYYYYVHVKPYERLLPPPDYRPRTFSSD